MNRSLLTIATIAILAFGPISAVLAQSPAQPPNPAPVNVGNNVVITDDDGRLDPSTNPNSSAFRIQVCDGPRLPPDLMKKLPEGTTYIPCDFNAVMLLIQHIINIMMVLGVLVAIIMFTYAGWLFISGKKDNIDKARSIFPKIFIGFIIMLSAWFIVYQILGWLTKNPAFRALLGAP